jgi:hypothetical protein
LVGLPDFGNARDVIAIWKSVQEHRADRITDTFEETKTILKVDVEKPFNDCIQSRQPIKDAKAKRKKVLNKKT